MIDAPAGDVLPKLTGKISPERIRLMRTPRPPEDLIEGFKSITDATSVISDIMDELGITGVIGASALEPTLPYASIVGPALVRNTVQREPVHESARDHVNRMAEFEAHKTPTRLRSLGRTLNSRAGHVNEERSAASCQPWGINSSTGTDRPMTCRPAQKCGGVQLPVRSRHRRSHCRCSSPSRAAGSTPSATSFMHSWSTRPAWGPSMMGQR